MLYNSFAIAGLKCLSQVNYTAHFGDLIQENWWFEIGDLVGDFTKKLVTRMDVAPKTSYLENKRRDFHSAHLRWCHDRWVSYILSGGYWFFITLCVMFAFYQRDIAFLLPKILLHHFHRLHLNITHLVKIKVSIQDKKESWRGVRHTRIFRCVQMRHVIREVTCANTQLPQVIAVHAIHYGFIMDGRSFGQN